MKRYFIITVDTEGDNCWDITNINQIISCENAKYLIRFQELCEKYRFVATYLTNYEMALAKPMIEIGLEGIKCGTLEIGAHVHAWNQPPIYPIVRSPFARGKPYLGEYPWFAIYNKIDYLTKLLEDTFGCPITSFRDGRWYMDAIIVRILERLGYIVDCTCTPGVSWSGHPGWSVGRKGTDWSKWNNSVQRFQVIELGGIRRSSLLEVPVTIEDGSHAKEWLRPNLNNKDEMKHIIDKALKRKCRFVELMIHSSELMPRGSVQLRTRFQLEMMYDCIESTFSYAKDRGFVGIGISEFVKQQLLENSRKGII